MAGFDRILRSNCRLTTERFVSVGLAAAFLVLSVAGCSRSSSTGSAGGNAGSNEASAAKPLSIGISFQELDNPYFVVMKEAAEEAAQSIGAELHLTDARHDVTKQISDIEDLIQKGIDILLNNPTDSVGVETAVQSAKKADIVVLAVASGGDRSAAIHAAARGGLIKELLIDEGGARSLLEFARQSAGGGEDASR